MNSPKENIKSLLSSFLFRRSKDESVKITKVKRLSFFIVFLLSVSLNSCGPLNADIVGDGTPYEGVQNPIQTYEIEVVSTDHIIGISFASNEQRTANIFNRESGEFEAGITTVETQTEEKKIFSGKDFTLEIENYSSTAPLPSSPLPFSIVVSLEDLNFSEEYFTKPLTDGLGAKVFSCAGKTELIPFAGGDGSKDYPFLICSIAQLENMGGVYRKRAFRLMSNLSFPSGYRAPSGWAPIGSPSAAFEGTFDGNSYKIENMFIDKSTNYSGLFGYTADATIKNLRVLGASVRGPSEVGIIAGQAAGGVFENLQTSGSVVVDANDNGGGLIGRINNGGSHATCSYLISHSSSSANVQVADVIAGGLVGQVNCSLDNSRIEDSFATGNISGTGPNAANFGGLVGSIMSGEIIRSYATGNVTCNFECGGLVGSLWYSNLTNTYSRGEVRGQTVGGLSGFIQGNGPTIESSYASGNVIASDGSAGGLVGSLSALSNVNIRNSFSASMVSLNSGTDIGGLVGVQSTSTLSIVNSKWLSGGTTKCVGWEPSTGGCTSTAIASDLQQASTTPLSPGVFSTIWNEISLDYPSLK